MLLKFILWTWVPFNNLSKEKQFLQFLSDCFICFHVVQVSWCCSCLIITPDPRSLCMSRYQIISPTIRVFIMWWFLFIHHLAAPVPHGREGEKIDLQYLFSQLFYHGTWPNFHISKLLVLIGFYKYAYKLIDEYVYNICIHYLGVCSLLSCQVS